MAVVNASVLYDETEKGEMAEALDTSTMDCPVCLGCLTEPKILPCGHQVCKKCVLATLDLETADKSLGCPSCHQPILPAQEKSNTDFSTFVDSLPTNHVTWMNIKSHQVLKDDAVCGICDEDSEAVSFCFQCDTKMCKVCSKYHSKMPGCSDHMVAELNSLTAKLFAAKKCMPCNIHTEKMVEKYCPAHGELVCNLCAWSENHKHCTAQDIATSAAKKRKEIKRQCEKLRQRGTALSNEIENLNKQIVEAEAKFARIREDVISRYGDIIKHYETQKHKFLDKIEEEEQAYMEEKLSNRDKLEALHAAIAAHTASINEMISDGPDVALLETLAQLKSRLDDLETKKAFKDEQNRSTVKEVYFDDKLIDKLKEMSGHMGELRAVPGGEKTIDPDGCILCDTLTEGTIKFEVQKAALIEAKGTDLDSKPHIIRNIAWNISLEPWEMPEKTHLGFYLRCDLPEHLKSCNVKYKLRILNTLPDRKPLQRETEDRFEKPGGIGYPQIITMAELMNPAVGYMKDGKVTFEAHIVPEDPELIQ